jgi:transcriptional regulator with PAS, ATPase and Fis domain
MSEPADPQDPNRNADSEFRWSAWFQRSSDAVFVLSRRRQILFVNRAWETLTGQHLRNVRKRVCKAQRDALAGSAEAVLHALRPPRAALEGKCAEVRRLVIDPQTGPRWWDIAYWPLGGPKELVGMLGKVIQVEVADGTGQPLPEKLMALRQRLSTAWCLQHLDSAVPAMQLVADQVRLASSTGVAALLVGEAGTGKHWLARTIHQESAHRENTFYALDCRHLPVGALAWVLFGAPKLAHRAGATLYLREPGALPRELQDRLAEEIARARDDARGPRILSGCRVDPATAVASGQLLPALHCLLGPLTLRMPPLRERRADLPALLRTMLERLARNSEKQVLQLSEDARELLLAHAWPGNLAELFAVLADALGKAKGDRLEACHLPWYLRSPAPVPERTLSLDTILEQVERRLIRWALTTAKGNKSRAAELLTIWRPRLLRRMEALGIKEGS